MSSEPIVFDGSDDHGLPVYRPPCRERALPDGRALYVHGYTLADMSAWKQHARSWDGVTPPEEPSPHTLKLAQVVYVCRTAADSEQRVFVVRQGGEKQVREQLGKRLPGRFLDAVCAESDSLALDGYLPPEETRRPHVEEARKALHELLGDKGFWARLNWLSLKMYGVSLLHNREPIGEVLTVVRLDQEAQDQILQAVGPLAMMAQGVG